MRLGRQTCPPQPRTKVDVLLAYEARRGTRVEFAGMFGAIQKCWGNSEHAAVDVLLDNGRLELFWLPDLSVVDDEDAAV